MALSIGSSFSPAPVSNFTPAAPALAPTSAKSGAGQVGFSAVSSFDQAPPTGPSAEQQRKDMFNQAFNAAYVAGTKGQPQPQLGGISTGDPSLDDAYIQGAQAGYTAGVQAAPAAPPPPTNPIDIATRNGIFGKGTQALAQEKNHPLSALKDIGTADNNCANFVSSVLIENGTLNKDLYSANVGQLEKNLDKAGFASVALKDAQRGDVVVMFDHGHVAFFDHFDDSHNPVVTGSNNMGGSSTQTISTFTAQPSDINAVLHAPAPEAHPGDLQ